MSDFATNEPLDVLWAIKVVDDDFPAVFDQHYDRLVSYLLRRVDRSTAEEIAQDTFLVAWDRREAYDASKGPPGPWLFGIAMHRMRHQFRSEQRRLSAYARTISTEPGPPDSSIEICSDLDVRAKQSRTAAALATLNQGEYEVVTLRFWLTFRLRKTPLRSAYPRGP